MLNPTCSARSAGRCLVRWQQHSFTHSTPVAAFTQRSASIHTTATTHAQQQQQQQQQQNKQQKAHPQPSSERKFRGKRRSRRQKGGETSDADDNTRHDKYGHDRNSAGAEKAAAFRREIEKETYSASYLSTSWTTPSIRPSQHPALQAVLEGVLSQQKQKNSRGSSVQQALGHQSDEGENEGYNQGRKTEKVELSTFDADEVVSSTTDKYKALFEEVASNKDSATEKVELSTFDAEVVSKSTDKDEAFSEEVASNKEVVSSSVAKEETSEHAAGATVEVVSGIADRRKRNWKPSVESRLQDKPYGYYANAKVVPSINAKNDASSEVGANEDEIVSSSTNSEATDFDMEMNDAVAIESANYKKFQSELNSSSPIEDAKSDSSDDDKYIRYSNAPSKSSSSVSQRKSAWFLPSTKSSPTNKNSSTGIEEAEAEEQNSNLNP